MQNHTIQKTDYLNPLQIKWLEALRSNKYKQTRSVLKRGDSFCCLGVLCDVADHDKWQCISDTQDGETYSIWEWEDEECVPPEELLKLVDIDCDEPKFNLEKYEPLKKNELGILTEMNDRKDKIFAEIADWLEEKWKAAYLEKLKTKE